jgi:sulfate adenylyltransferase subunit 2
VFSLRSRRSEWEITEPPQCWNQYRTDLAPGEDVRIQPILHWTELDVWRYFERRASR